MLEALGDAQQTFQQSPDESVALIERDRVGGTCVNYGCTPTKALVASARAAYMARRGDDFGVVLDGDVRVDMKKVHARMKRIAGESNANVLRWIEGMENVDLICDHARFVGERKVEVGGEVLDAEKVFINVGGRARIPDIGGLDEVDYLTSKGMLELDELPEHLVIVGGSYVGIEFGQMFRRFGSRVTIVEMGPRLISREDPEVSEAIRQILEDEGIDVQLESTCFAVSGGDGGVAVRIDRAEGADEVDGSHLLLATGRVPNTDDLGLESAGVATDGRGYIEVDDKLRTSAEKVWALGDCNREGAFTHTAWNDYKVLAANLLGDEGLSINDRILCYGLFMDPPLARIGMTEAQARASGREVLVGRRPMARVARARERSETAGLIKILVDAESEQLLGATILGINGDEVIHALLTLMYSRASYEVMTHAVHIHPTVSELLPTVLESLEPLE